MHVSFSDEYLAKKKALFYERIVQERVLQDDSKLFNFSLTPYLMDLEKYQKLSKHCELLMSSIEKFLRVYVESEHVQSMFPELEKQRDLTLLRPNFMNWVHLARFDFVETPTGGFQLLETNAACPVFLTAAMINKIYVELDMLPSFLGKTLRLVEQPMDNPKFFTTTLVELSKEVTQNGRPNIAVLKSKVQPIGTDVDLLVKETRTAGYKCMRSTVQDLETKDGRTYSGDFRIDVAYQKIDITTNESNQMTFCLYKQSEQEVAGYLEGIRENKFLCVNSPISSLVAENKRIVSLISRPEFRKYFTEEENAAIDELIPETHSFDPTNQQDYQKYAPEFLSKKHDWVIKTVGDTRGRGVFVGRDCQDSVWAKLVSKLRNEPYIIQKFVEQEPSPVLDNSDPPQLQDMISVISVHMVKGKACGLLSRSSLGNITTASGADGFGRAAFVVENISGLNPN